MNQQAKQMFIERYDQIKSFLQEEGEKRSHESLIDMRNILESFPFFIQFTNPQTQDFITMCRYLELECYEEPQTLFEQGDVADKFYICLKGQVEIFVLIPGINQVKQVGSLGIGGAFGELALLFDSQRNATIKVLPNTELIVLHKEIFKKLMQYSSSQYANQAFNLLNSMDEFKSLEFPDRVRLASKMEYKTFPSNHTVLKQGEMLNHFYIVETGIIKCYKEVTFNTTDKGSISFNPNVRKLKGGRVLQIEIDEVATSKYMGDYELIHFRPSQFTAITHMPCSLFTISSVDFNLMAHLQLKPVVESSKPYPTDVQIRESFLSGIQWKVFRKKLVDDIQNKKLASKVRDPQTILSQDQLYYYYFFKTFSRADLKMFAVKSLTFENLMNDYKETSRQQSMVGMNTKSMIENPYQEEGQILFGTKVQVQKEKRFQPLYQNVDKALKDLKSKYSCLPQINNHSKKILPKINPKVGSSVYNILIAN